MVKEAAESHSDVAVPFFVAIEIPSDKCPNPLIRISEKLKTIRISLTGIHVLFIRMCRGSLRQFETVAEHCGLLVDAVYKPAEAVITMLHAGRKKYSLIGKVVEVKDQVT